MMTRGRAAQTRPSLEILGLVAICATGCATEEEPLDPFGTWNQILSPTASDCDPPFTDPIAREWILVKDGSSFLVIDIEPEPLDPPATYTGTVYCEVDSCRLQLDSRWTSTIELPPYCGAARCTFSWCGTANENACPVEWFSDADCDCGCQADDPACDPSTTWTVDWHYDHTLDADGVIIGTSESVVDFDLASGPCTSNFATLGSLTP